MSVYDWSIIAANNANADSLINWAEGQPPGSVNNSARAMMQRVKELLNDLGGIVVAGGSANALTVAAASPFTAYADGRRVSFRAAADNTGAATLSVNSIGAKPIHVITSSGVEAVSAGQIQANGIYEAVYSAILNGGSGAWLLLNPTVLQAVPAGIIAQWSKNVAPSGWLECSGAAVSRTTYARLFAEIGTTWGPGNGSTTFNLPDFRGEFVRGWDNGRGVDSGRVFASSQGGAIQSHTHTGTTDSAGGHTTTIPKGSTGGGDGVQNGPTTGGNLNANPTPAHSHPFTTNATGGTETRPRNVAAMFIIKT